MTSDASAAAPLPRKRRPLTSVAAGAVVALLAAMVLAADQFSKYLALQNLTEGEPVQILGDALIFVLVFNPGGAFSMGSGTTWIFTIALALVACVIVWLAATRIRSRLWAVVLGLLLGGVLGNLTDRLFRDPGFPVGHVVDFINTPWMWLGFPPAIYNVADIFIVCDMILVAVLILVGVHMDGSREARKNGEDQRDSEQTLLGGGDEFAPDPVTGFGSEFPVADAEAGVPADERGLPPLTDAQQAEVEREADRLAGGTGDDLGSSRRDDA